MRAVESAPHYGVLLIIAILSLRGSATVQETLIGTLATLGFRSWPRPIGQIGAGIVGIVFLFLMARGGL